MENYYFTTNLENEGQRLDHYLTFVLPVHSRSFFQNLIRQQHILVDGKGAKANLKLKANQNVAITVPAPKEVSIIPEDIPLNIVYEDSDIVIIDKPQGMVVHPAVGNYTGTLVNALLYQCSELSGINGEIRPGIVHRIDKDTSGLLVVAKNDFAHRHLAQQIKEKSASRVYLALVEKNIKSEQGTICAPIGRHPVERKKMAVVSTGRDAATHYKILERFGDYTYVEVKLETGRTHQIRVHMAYKGHPLVGDQVYGSTKQKFNLNGQALHAARLELLHPRTDKPMAFSSPLPDYFDKLLQAIRKKSK